VVELGKKAELRDMPRPKVGENEVLVKTAFSGVSVGTEMWIATGRRKDYGEPPFINGYQVTGEVVEVGKAVKDFRAGDWVALFCNGAHGEYAKGNAQYCHKLPGHSGSELAKVASLFVQPSVGANALSMASVNTGDTVLITGQGLIGQCTAQLARLRGAFVAASDISPARLQTSREHCADWVIDANAGPVSELIKPRSPNGFDVVIESTGFNALVDDALNCCKWEGRFVFEGFYPDNITYRFNIPHGKQLRAFYPVFIGTYANREGVIRLMHHGLLKMEPLISHSVKWSESADLYNRLFTRERDSFNGIVFDWR
jgi:2-desacetyl-2-hydroxyethyl bacteriochlorophyllide A dehydrogenase